MNGDPEAFGVIHEVAPILTVGPSEIGGVYLEIAERALIRPSVEQVPDEPHPGNVTLVLTTDNAKYPATLLMKAATSSAQAS